MPVSVPTFIKQAWASVGTKFTIPDNANPTTGRAGWDQGFSPINLTPVAAGGIPPFGQDMNGVLYDITNAIQYIQAGRSFPYNQEFADAIGGYGKGSLVSIDSDLSVVYKSKVDDNLTPPPSANWEVYSLPQQATESISGIAKVATSSILQEGVNNDSFATSKGIKDAGLWPLGVGQTWQNLTGSRSPNITYTNSSFRPIAISVTANTSTNIDTYCFLSIQVAGVVVISSSSTSRGSSVPAGCFTIVPPGATYSFSAANGTLSAFLELK